MPLRLTADVEPLLELLARVNVPLYVVAVVGANWSCTVYELPGAMV